MLVTAAAVRLRGDVPSDTTKIAAPHMAVLPLGNRMARRKIFEARVNLPITAELLARIDATLESDEYRVDFIRDALKRELERREPARKTSKRGHK